MKKISIALIILLLLLSACTGKKETQTASGANTQEEQNMAQTEFANSENSPKILVAYFSCTGNTRAVAAHITDILNSQSLAANLYEIKPQTPYTTEDLIWRDDTSRASKENADPSSRPVISKSVENMENYDTIFLGYPIWWGQAPKIIYTFMESYDFSGKTIVPFCTSGSSSLGTSAANLQPFSSASTKWLSGTRFAANASPLTVAEWIKTLEL